MVAMVNFFKNKIYIITFLIICTFLIILFALNKNKPEEYQDITNISLLLSDTNLTTNKLFNLNLKYISTSYVCNEKKILALIIVTSYLGNVEMRSAMRRAFSNEKLTELNVRRVFLLGTKTDDEYITQKAIDNESEKFGDIVQGNFHEAYRNLTYKHLMGLKWASEHCDQAQFVIKMDDDTVLNLHKVLQMLNETKLPRENLLAGYVLKNMLPIREKANKWYVTEDEYEADTYPTFLSGWFYITNPATCKKLVLLSKYEPYFWIDDTYVTGILAKLLKVRHYSVGEIFTVHPEFLRCCIRDIQTHNYDCEVLVGPNGGDNNLFYEFNHEVEKCFVNKCAKRTKSLNDTCISERKENMGRGKSVIETYRLT